MKHAWIVWGMAVVMWGAALTLFLTGVERTRQRRAEATVTSATTVQFPAATSDQTTVCVERVASPKPGPDSWCGTLGQLRALLLERQ